MEDNDPQANISREPEPFTQSKLNDLVMDFGLSKEIAVTRV